MDLWHDDLGQIVKENHIARDYYTATVSATAGSGAGQGYARSCFLIRECHPFFYLLWFLADIFLRREFFKLPDSKKRSRLEARLEDECVCVMCASAVSDQVQSLVDC